MNKQNSNGKMIYWEKILEKQKASKETIRQFCKDNQLNLHTFQYWQQKIKTNQNQQAQIVKLPIQITKESRNNNRAGIMLRMNETFSVEIDTDFHSESLLRLIRVLKQV